MGKDPRKKKGEDRGGKKGLRGERRERISTGRGEKDLRKEKGEALRGERR